MSYLKMLYEIEEKLSQLKSKEERFKEVENELKINEQISSYEEEIKELNASKTGFLQRKAELERELEEQEKEKEFGYL